MKHFLKMQDIDGDTVRVKVGDYVAGFCITTKSTRIGKILSIKDEFKIEGFKYTPNYKSCIFIRGKND